MYELSSFKQVLTNLGAEFAPSLLTEGSNTRGEVYEVQGYLKQCPVAGVWTTLQLSARRGWHVSLTSLHGVAFQNNVRRSALEEGAPARRMLNDASLAGGEDQLEIAFFARLKPSQKQLI